MGKGKARLQWLREYRRHGLTDPRDRIQVWQPTELPPAVDVDEALELSREVLEAIERIEMEDNDGGR